MPKPYFKTLADLAKHIDDYFKHIECPHYLPEQAASEDKEQIVTHKKTKLRETEPATIAGLAFFLGFNSRKAFEDYKRNGKFSNALKRGCLRIEAAYEKKLHSASATGAIFALKSMGWNEPDEGSKSETNQCKSLKMVIVDSGPKLAGNEKDVDM